MIFLSKNLKEVNTYTNKKEEIYLKGTTGGMNIGVYTLFKGGVNNIDLAFIRCYCPSSFAFVFFPRKLISEIKYIQRQGERFTTFLTEKGNILLDNLPKSDIEDLVNLSGEEYFNKMTYEYILFQKLTF